MKKFLVACLIGAMALLPTSIGARPAIMDSVVALQADLTNPMTGERGRYQICTGGVVDEHVVLTAAHCLTDEKGEVREVRFYINGYPAAVGDVNVKTDLATLIVPKLKGKPVLVLAPKPLDVGDYIETAGYPGGLSLMWFKGNVSRVGHVFEGSDQKYVLFDLMVRGGQSGSPIVNIDGQLVSVMQIGLGRDVFTRASGGAMWEDLVEFLKGGDE